MTDHQNAIFHNTDDHHQVHLSIILHDGFSMIALSALIEPLKIANNLLDQTIYSWEFLSKNSSKAISSSGCILYVQHIAHEKDKFVNLVILGEKEHHNATISLDMAFDDITARFGRDMAILVQKELAIETTNKNSEIPDNITTTSAPDALLYHPKLSHAINEMENSTETILSRNEIARRVGISQRQLERLFQRYLNTSPARYYLKLRLNRAKSLLIQTPMAITEIASACGFISASHFSKCYRELFKITPKKERLKCEKQANVTENNNMRHYNNDIMSEKEVASQ